jgi:hypothetical protein
MNMKRRHVLITVACIAIVSAMTFLRIRHERIGWGEYWSVNVVVPWQ